MLSGKLTLCKKEKKAEEKTRNEHIKKLKEKENCVETNFDNNPSSHILMFHPWNTKSHRIQQNALLEGLLARGHTLTGVFPQGSNIKNERYTEIVVPDG